MKKLTVLLSILVLALGILAAGCGGGDKKADDKKAAAPAPAAKEELIVGTEPSFAPFEFPEKDSKEFTGFDMDLIRAVHCRLQHYGRTETAGYFLAALLQVRSGFCGTQGSGRR